MTNHVQEFRGRSRARTNSIAILRDMPGDRAGGMQLRKGEFSALGICFLVCAVRMLSCHLPSCLLVSPSFPPSSLSTFFPSLLACLSKIWMSLKSTIWNQSLLVLFRIFFAVDVVVGKKSPVYGRWKDFYFHLKYKDQKLLYYDNESVRDLAVSLCHITYPLCRIPSVCMCVGSL